MKNHITFRLHLLSEIMGTDYPMLSDDLARIESDYQQMVEFFMAGGADPQIERVFNDIDARLTRLIAKYQMTYLCHKAPLYLQMSELLKGDTVLDIQEMQAEMERYEIDLTMLELEESEETKHQKLQEIAARQYNMRQKIFAKFLLSPLWTKETADLIKALMLSPTVDKVAVQLMITATLISCLNIFDDHKYIMLYQLHKEAEDIAVNQKSAVAVMLLSKLCGKTTSMQIAHQTNIRLEDFPIDESLLITTQQMMVYTIDSKSIGKKIQTELMPDIIKSSDIIIKQGKIVENPNDRIEEIITPNKDEETIEKFEESVRKMQDMQKDGADIFYAGFSHAKRLPFFNKPINWFFPFYRNHPNLNDMKIDDECEKILGNLIKRTPFCESDKYSFALIMGQVFSQMPPKLKEILANGQADFTLLGGSTEFNPEILERRKYLQDLYRFFKLSPFTNCLHNPFAESNMLFIKPYLETEGLLNEESVKSIFQFLRRINKFDVGAEIAKSCHATSLKMRVLCAFIHLACGNDHIALNQFVKLLQQYPDNLQVLYGMAKCLWITNSRDLVEQHIDKILNALNALHFKNENDKTTHNLLAKMYILAGEYDKAMREIKILYETDSVEPDLLMVTAYLYFLNDKQAGALKFLKAYKQSLQDKADDDAVHTTIITNAILINYLQPTLGKELSLITVDIIEHYIAT